MGISDSSGGNESSKGTRFRVCILYRGVDE